MDIEAQETVQRELRRGETSRWIGRPNATRFVVQQNPAAFWVGIVWTVLFPAPFYNNITGGHAAPLIIFFIVLGIGLVMLASPLWHYWKGLKTIYAVTNQRLLIIDSRGTPPLPVKSYTPADIDDIVRVEREDGSGTIFFASERHSGGKGGPYIVKIGFVAIADVREVERHIRELTQPRR